MDLASAAMKTHGFLGRALLGGGLVLVLQGCGAGTYKIPDVAPVVKQKPEEDILGGDDAPATEAPKPSAPDDATDEPKTDTKK
jgi:hypothetical protein